MEETTVFDTLNPNNKNYIPYGGFRKAPTKFTSKYFYKGRKKERKGDWVGWWCKCDAHNYSSYINIQKFTFPSFPYMAIRNKPFREVKRKCWKCGHIQTNTTLEEVKIETGENNV